MLKKALIYFLLLSFFSLTNTGCSQKNQGQDAKLEKQSVEQNVEKEKAPDQLKEIENNIEKMINILKGPAITDEQEAKQGRQAAGNDMQQEKQQQEQQEGQQSGDQEKQNRQEQPKEQEQQGKQQENQQEKQNGSQQGQQGQDIWQEIINIVHSMHFQWNSFMPLAARQGAANALIENFGSSLNELTNRIQARNEQECLQSLSTLYSYIPDFYALYKGKVSPEIKRIRYFVRNAIIVSRVGDWEQAVKDISEAKSSWSLFKNSISQEQQGTAGKLDYSLFELERVVNEKNQLLTEIKGSVLLSNISEMEKEMEKK